MPPRNPVQYSRVHGTGELSSQSPVQYSRMNATRGLCRQKNTVQYSRVHATRGLCLQEIQYNTHVFTQLEGCAAKKYSTILTCSRNWRIMPPVNTVQYSRVLATRGLCRQEIQYNTHVFMPLEGCAAKKSSTILTCSYPRNGPAVSWPGRRSQCPRPSTPARQTWRRSWASRSH